MTGTLNRETGYVISGRGTVEIQGQRLGIAPGDTYAIPNYAWHSISNDSSEPLRIFAVHDTPVIKAIGMFYEEPTPTLGAHPAPPIPGVPHHPIYRTTALLAEDEAR